ncbi:protein IWS1 homolog isoform X2 [Epinephelus fuscoguttatus]|uniref:protein IWS1 homolog isoform X2 n=1 Tax=Epinephelus fuscoguttatus TaxID=293821 RepID=UPI0020D0B426|nr:protein IWS1 homolog isoform X2 [Epinephelus fuscoguttatus]
MDGEEDDFMSASHSDDGGGTPVQDEHPASDGEEARSDGHQSEDDGSNDEDAPHAMKTSGVASGSDNELHQGADSDSEGEAPSRRHDDKSDSDGEAGRGRHNDDKSDSEGEAPRGRRRDDDKSDSEMEASRPADSDDDDDSPVKRRMSVSDNEEESPVKHGASDNEEGGRSPPANCRGSSSDMEEGEERPKAAAESDSENEEDKPAASPARRSNADSDSDTETPARRKAAQIDSDEEEEEKQQEKAEGGGGGGGGKWKAVMQSDSEDEEEEGQTRKASAGSDGEQQQEEREQKDDSDDEDEKPVKRKKAILSDSEDEEKADKPAVKRSRAVSDDENSDSDGGSVGPDKSLAAKLRELGSDSGSEDDERLKATATGKKDEKALFGSDSDSGDGDEEEKMIADIFGESGDEEEEEFTGFNQEDLEGEKKESKEKQQEVEEESDSDEGVDRSGQDTSFMSDFDIMLARRKAMNSRKRRHRDGGTFISDADDVVSAMISKMNEAAEEDRTLNSQKKPALKKLTLLPQVVMHLKKQDLKETFIDSGVMSAIKEWISPLPDKSLPALRIREELLRILQELPSVSQETLKHSGIGRSVMFLYKHPKESRANKDLALKLINEWSRPIFGLTSNYKGMTREERQQRDLDQQMPQRQRLSQPQKVERAEEPDVFSPPISSGGQTPRRDLEKQLTGEEKALRPGDPGFCARARVPMPSNKDYVVRPKWNVEMESNRSYKKGISLLEKHKRRFAEKRKMGRPQGAVKISIEGNRMPL